MDPPTSCKMPFTLLVSLVLLVPTARAAGVICEDLPSNQCAFAISSSSKRCILESYRHSGAPTEFKCWTSQVGVPKMANYIENDGCINICGVDRNMVGISSDALLELQFKDKLCSPECFQNCPSIIDLFYNLAAGEGVYLPDLCQAHQSEPHRAMAEIRSSGAAPGPRSSAGPGAAPGPRSRTVPGPSASRKVSPSGAVPAAAPVAGAKGTAPTSAPVAGAKASKSDDSSAAAAATSTKAGAGDDDDAGSTQDDDDDII